jgi:hypothetical protein
MNGNHLEESGHGLNKVISKHTTKGTEESQEKSIRIVSGVPSQDLNGASPV